MAVCAFNALAFIFQMIWVAFATFATYLASSTHFFVVSKFLTLQTSQGRWYILLSPFYCVASPDFFWYWWFLKRQNVCMGLYCFIISANSDSSVFFYSLFFFLKPLQSLLVLLVTVPYFSQRLWRYLIWRVDRHDIWDYEIFPFSKGFQRVFCFPLLQAGFQFGLSIQFWGYIYWILFFRSKKVTVDLILYLVMIQ